MYRLNGRTITAVLLGLLMTELFEISFGVKVIPSSYTERFGKPHSTEKNISPYSRKLVAGKDSDHFNPIRYGNLKSKHQSSGSTSLEKGVKRPVDEMALLPQASNKGSVIAKSDGNTKQEEVRRNIKRTGAFQNLQNGNLVPIVYIDMKTGRLKHSDEILDDGGRSQFQHQDGNYENRNQFRDNRKRPTMPHPRRPFMPHLMSQGRMRGKARFRMQPFINTSKGNPMLPDPRQPRRRPNMQRPKGYPRKGRPGRRPQYPPQPRPRKHGQRFQMTAQNNGQGQAEVYENLEDLYAAYGIQYDPQSEGNLQDSNGNRFRNGKVQNVQTLAQDLGFSKGGQGIDQFQDVDQKHNGISGESDYNRQLQKMIRTSKNSQQFEQNIDNVPVGIVTGKGEDLSLQNVHLDNQQFRGEKGGGNQVKGNQLINHQDGKQTISISNENGKKVFVIPIVKHVTVLKHIPVIDHVKIIASEEDRDNFPRGKGSGPGIPRPDNFPRGKGSGPGIPRPDNFPRGKGSGPGIPRPDFNSGKGGKGFEEGFGDQGFQAGDMNPSFDDDDGYQDFDDDTGNLLLPGQVLDQNFNRGNKQDFTKGNQNLDKSFLQQYIDENYEDSHNSGEIHARSEVEDVQANGKNDDKKVKQPLPYAEIITAEDYEDSKEEQRNTQPLILNNKKNTNNQLVRRDKSQKKKNNLILRNNPNVRSKTNNQETDESEVLYLDDTEDNEETTEVKDNGKRQTIQFVEADRVLRGASTHIPTSRIPIAQGTSNKKISQLISKTRLSNFKSAKHDGHVAKENRRKDLKSLKQEHMNHKFSQQQRNDNGELKRKGILQPLRFTAQDKINIPGHLTKRPVDESIRQKKGGVKVQNHKTREQFGESPENYFSANLKSSSSWRAIGTKNVIPKNTTPELSRLKRKYSNELDIGRSTQNYKNTNKQQDFKDITLGKSDEKGVYFTSGSDNTRTMCTKNQKYCEQQGPVTNNNPKDNSIHSSVIHKEQGLSGSKAAVPNFDFRNPGSPDTPDRGKNWFEKKQRSLAERHMARDLKAATSNMPLKTKIQPGGKTESLLQAHEAADTSGFGGEAYF